MIKIVFVIFFVSCKFGSGFETYELQEFGRRVRNLSLELFHVTEPDTKGDVVMAPYFIWNLISLVAFSASAETWNQLYSIIGESKQNAQYVNSIYKYVTNLLLRKSPGVAFETKLVVFYDANINLSGPFKRSILNSGAHLKELHFDETVLASKLANAYIRLPGDLRSKRMVFNKADFEDSSMIVSGIAEFKGDWSLPFKESNTIIREGYNGSVHMMRQRATVYFIDIDMISASVMELTYGEYRDFSMLIIRPYENVELNNVIRSLAKLSFPHIFQQLREEGLKEMDIELPKFSLTSVLLLNNPFIDMGIVDIFVPEQANFSEVSTSEDMYIFNFEHRTVLMVSEAGTVATALTPANLAMGKKDSKLGTAAPFLFFIVHGPSMNILFCGKYGG